MAPKELPIFETLFSKFTATDIIGEGGAGGVFKVADETGNTYAIKLLDQAKATGEKRKRFKPALALTAPHQKH